MSFIHIIASQINSQFEYKISPDKIILDGTTYTRWGDKGHCWGIGNEWVYKGEKYWRYTFASWKLGEPITIKSWSDHEKMSKDFYDRLKEHTAATDFRIEQLKQEKNQECKKTWLPIYENASTNFSHDYLNRKIIKKFNARLSNGQLLIPIYDKFGFVGVQRIWADGTKRFSSGIKIKGSFSYLREFENEKIAFLCEGFATGATIQEAFPSIPVLIAFSCHNIPEAIETIRALNPNIKIVIAADRDSSGQGEKWAKIAQKRHTNVIYRLPQFPTNDDTRSDFNDLYRMYRQDYQFQKVIDDLSFDESEFLSIVALGHDGDIYYYTSSENQQIVELNSRSHDQKGFARLIPNQAYWAKKYGVIENEKPKILWTNAMFDLMNQCSKKGIFNESLIRGIGIWDDEGQIVIHDGAKTKNLNHVSKYLYPKKAPVNLEMIYGKENHLLTLWNDSFSNLYTKNEASKAYLAAWYVQSFIFPIMDWKFHVWITGEKGTGKSKILEFIQDAGLFIQGFKNTTVAGLQGDCDQNQTAVVYDEAEGTSHMTKDLVEFARQMTNNGGFKQSRGNAGGGSRSIDAHIVFAFGSIQDGIVNAADRSRFFSIQMGSIKNQPREVYRKIRSGFKLAKEKKYEIWGHIYKNIHNIKKYFEIVKERLCDDFDKIEPRQADQIGACMACLLPFQLEIDQELTDELIEVHYKGAISLLDLKNDGNDYLQDNEERETQTAFQDLCSTIVDKSSGMTVGRCLSYILMNHNLKETCEQHLESFGLKIVKGDLFMASKNKNLLASCKDYPRLAKLLQQDDALFLRKSVAKISGVSTKGIFISLKSFDPRVESDV